MTHTKRPTLYLSIATRRPSDPKIALRAVIRESLATSYLNPMWGEVAVMCLATSLDTGVTITGDGNESLLLERFNNHIRLLLEQNNGITPLICGWDIARFDLPFLWVRMMIKGFEPAVRFHPGAKRVWKPQVLDLREVLPEGDLHDWVCTFGGESKRAQCEEGLNVEQAKHLCEIEVRDSMFLHQRMLQIGGI